jgi:ribosomal-protein-alanine N-acetyltransferase
MTPSISTGRLSLRPLTRASKRQVEWLNDPDVVRYSEQRHRNHTLSSQLDYVRSFAGNSRIWSIHTVDDGEHIGNITATHDEPNNVSDVGILIGETRVWGKGYGFEAWKAVCNWLLDPNLGGVRKLESGCMRPNEAMLKIIRDTGFTEEGERKNHFLINGNQPVSAVLFGRMR